MYLGQWIKRKIVIAIACLLIVVGCGYFLLLQNSEKNNESETQYVINQVRLQVSGIMLYLADNLDSIQRDPTAHTVLRELSIDKKLDLILLQLNGTVIFNTSDSKLVQKIDLRSSFQYDKYTSSTGQDLIKVVFPVVDDVSNFQVANVIFTLPAEGLEIKSSHSVQLSIFLIMISVIVILVVLLLLMQYKVNVHMVQPLLKLKYASEAILKGNYEQKTEYSKSDEMGDFYAMFDQMRMEIMHLSTQRIGQERAQKELITNISHDIKTPLTIVKAYIDAIQGGICGEDMDDVMEYVEIMQIHTDKMARLVEDLLVHALRELGQISVNPKEQYSRKVFSDILIPIGHYVRTTGITLIEPKSIPNILILVDSNRLEQVMSNLITNALKHTSTGDSIAVGIEQEPKYLKVTITDTGEGILPQDMPFIFERYFKGPSSIHLTDDKQEGSGLGLSICKTIIEAHGGTISFKSIKGKGTVFSFTIPLC